MCGVRLRWLLLWTLAWLALLPDDVSRAQQFSVADVPNPRANHAGWVTDTTQVLGPYTALVEQRFSQLHAELGVEVALVVLPSIGQEQPRPFATELFKQWGIGRKGKDDGVLVLHVLDQRRIEIETGYGMEGTLPDAKCSWLIQEVAIPLFKQSDFARGHLALSAGLELGIRNPQLSHDDLVRMANTSVQGLPPYVAPNVAGPAEPPPSTAVALLEGAKERHVFTLFSLLLLCIPALVLRLRAHKALYREKARRYTSPVAVWAFGVGLALVASIFAVVEPDELWMLWLSSGIFVLTFLGIGGRAVQVYRQASQRHAARVCEKCKQPMVRLDEATDDAKLQYGQQIEEAIQSVDYDVWTCPCHNVKVFEFQGSTPAKKCAACSYKTDRLAESIVLRPATRSSQGLKEEHYVCAHCHVQRSEQVVIPRLSSSSSSSSSGGGSSFGGGSSGGGGAGGSY